LLGIIKFKKISAVTFTYFSKKRKVKDDGFFGLFDFQKEVQELKEMTISGEDEINLFPKEGLNHWTVQFSSKDEFEKFKSKDYDENSLWLESSVSLFFKYQINFHTLKSIKYECV